MNPKQVLQIFTVQRKNEPKSLVVARTIAVILFSLILVGYIIVQIYDVRLDTPVFATIHSRDEEKTIPLPNMHFTHRYRFTLTCGINGPITKLSPERCSAKHLKQPELSVNSKGLYEGVFKANGANFIKSDLETFEIIITMNKPEEIPSDDLGVELRIFDSQVHDPLDSTSKNNETNLHVVSYHMSLAELNFHYLSFKQHYQIGLSRVRTKVVVDNWWNMLGVPPSYRDETHLNSEVESYPYTLYDNLSNSYARSVFVMKSWRVPLEQEQKAKTLFDTFGQIAGVAGTLSIFYAFLFGAGPNAIQSWGIVQKFKCFGIKRNVKKHFDRRYPRLPFIHKSRNEDSVKENEDIDVHETQIDILERLDAVENFLREYVVDVNFLEQLGEINDDNSNNTKKQEKREKK